MGPTLSATGNVEMDTRLSGGDRVRGGFLEEVMSKLNSDKTSKVIPREDKLFAVLRGTA